MDQEGLEEGLADVVSRSTSLVSANDQSWFTRKPQVHGPLSFSTTAVGPIVHLPFPRSGSVVVGMPKAGPTPQVTLPPLGEKKADRVMSPVPKAADSPGVGDGWLMKGRMSGR